MQAGSRCPELGITTMESKFVVPNLGWFDTIQAMQDLSRSPIGSTVRIRGHDHRFVQDYEVDAYLPSPLPGDVSVGTQTWVTIGEAMAELGRLDAASHRLPNPSLVSRIATRVEAVGTSALEGTYAELPEVFAAETAPEEAGSRDIPPRVREVLNYAVAAELGHSTVATQPISRGLMSSLQAVIVRGTDADGPEAGEVRSSQVFIGPKDRPITEARFVPPPPGDQLDALVDDWVAWIADDGPGAAVQILMRVAVAHYQFESIHPYHDGNGRLGRLAAVLHLRRAGVITSPVLAISPWLKRNEDGYRDGLLEVSVSGNWEPWVSFFTKALVASSRESQARIDRLLDHQREISDLARERIPRGRLAIDIADALIEYPLLSVADAEARYGKTNQAARNAINKLVEVGLVEPYNDVAYGRLYWDPGVFRAIAAVAHGDQT